MVDRNVRTVAVLLLIAALLAGASFAEGRATVSEAEGRLGAQAEQHRAQIRSSGMSAEQQEAALAQVDAAQDRVEDVKRRPLVLLLFFLAGATAVLCAVMGLHLLVRGTAPWIATGLLVLFVLSVVGTLAQLPMLLEGAGSSYGAGYLVGSIVRLVVGWWAYTVIRDAVSGDVRPGRRADAGGGEEAPTRDPSRRPSFLRDANAPAPVAAPALERVAVVVPAALVAAPVPAALLHVQGALDATGFGGWVEAPGAVQVQLSPAPPAGTELLAADAAGAWRTLTPPDPATGSCVPQLPAGSWYLLVRSTQPGAQTTLWVAPHAPQQELPAAA